LAFGLLISCAHRPERLSRPEESFVVQIPGASDVEAKVTPEALVGPEMHISRGVGAIRGEAFHRPVEVKWSGEEVSGMIGRTPVQLSVRRDGGELRASGLYQGQPSDLRISRRGIEGPIGQCSYSLKAQTGSYQGSRSCRHGPDGSMVMKIPEALWSTSEAEQVALIALILAR
jgi:hypothetical protein